MSEDKNRDNTPNKLQPKQAQNLMQQSQGLLQTKKDQIQLVRKVSQSHSQLLTQKGVQFDEEKLQKLSKEKLIELLVTQNKQMNKLFSIQQEKIQQLYNENQQQQMKIKKCQHQIKMLKDNYQDQQPDIEFLLESNLQNSMFNSEIKLNNMNKSQPIFVKKRFSDSNNEELIKNIDNLRKYNHQLNNLDLDEIFQKLIDKKQKNELDEEFWKLLKTYSTKESNLQQLNNQIVEPLLKENIRSSQKQLLLFYKNLSQKQKLGKFLQLQIQQEQNKKQVEQFFNDISKSKNLDLLANFAEIFEDVKKSLDQQSSDNIMSQCNDYVNDLKKDLQNVDRKKLSLVMQSFRKID